MKTALPIFVMAASAFLFGCNGSSGPAAKTAGGETLKTGDGKTVSQAAANKFNAGIAAMSKHDHANDWNAGACKQVAGLFADADSNQKGNFFEAQYNQGVAYQRCKQNDEAKKIFNGILSKNSGFHRARVQLALYKFQENKDIEAAISEMNQAIKDAEFKNEEALVNLAMLQMKRDASSGGDNCDNDFDCAKLNLQRALAINDSFMPAFNQLAVFYLESAKKKAGHVRGKGNVSTSAAKKKRADAAALELAALVVSQALRKNPRYAPVHNTSGLISAELGDLSTAARSFGTARKLDPKFFEAHMNYAAVNLQFRGFKQAEQAYRAALSMRQNDYEANLGLALAVRGQINDSNFNKNVKEAESLLAKAKSIDGSRPETYYNEAILVQEFKAREGGQKAEPILMKAKSLFDQFISKAGSNEAFAAAVKRSKERSEEIDQIITFNKQTREEQARMEADQKRRDAEALKKKQQEKK